MRRDKPFEENKYDNFGLIGYTGIKYLQKEKSNNKQNHLQVFRRNKKDILRRKNDFRRNTIDVSLFEIEKAKEMHYLSGLNVTKSMESIDNGVKINEYHFMNETSLPGNLI